MEALDSQEDCKHSNKDKQMSIGRKKFNMDPKKGEVTENDTNSIRNEVSSMEILGRSRISLAKVEKGGKRTKQIRKKEWRLFAVNVAPSSQFNYVNDIISRNICDRQCTLQVARLSVCVYDESRWFGWNNSKCNSINCVYLSERRFRMKMTNRRLNWWRQVLAIFKNHEPIHWIWRSCVALISPLTAYLTSVYGNEDDRCGVLK